MTRSSPSDQVDALSRLVHAIAPQTVEARNAFEAICCRRSFAAGSYLLKAGERATMCHFIVSGLVRELYMSDRGVEHTRSFIAEGDMTGSLIDLLSGEPSITFLEAAEPSKTISWRYAELLALADRFPEIERVLRRWAERLYVRKTRREHDMLALSAGERLDSWRAEQPALDGRVRRKDLASYLGITPEHLSRLLARRR